MFTQNGFEAVAGPVYLQSQASLMFGCLGAFTQPEFALLAGSRTHLQ